MTLRGMKAESLELHGLIPSSTISRNRAPNSLKLSLNILAELITFRIPTDCSNKVLGMVVFVRGAHPFGAVQLPTNPYVPTQSIRHS